MIAMGTRIRDRKDGAYGTIRGYEPQYAMDPEVKKYVHLSDWYIISWDEFLTEKTGKRKVFSPDDFKDRLEVLEKETDIFFPVRLLNAEYVLNSIEASAVEEFIKKGRGDWDG